MRFRFFAVLPLLACSGGAHQIKSPNELWATMRGNVMYKSAERVEAANVGTQNA